MSTPTTSPTRTAAAPPLTVPDLISYFQGGAKDRSRFRIGIEQEKIAVTEDGKPVPYDGPRGTSEILDRFAKRGFTATREDGHVIALSRDGDRITVEPGGQLELSGGALATAAACATALDAHVREVAALARPLGIHFIGVGIRPFGKLDDVTWLPKRRYGVMREYFPRQGRDSRLAHYMMKMTATVQANFDYASEAEAVDKIRTANGITSAITALYAASPILEGRPTGYKSFRAAVWLETDADRTGLLPFVFEPGFGFRDYVEWALDVPMFFVVRDGVYRAAQNLTFRRFIREGWEGATATLADWEVHLSTLFPEVRLKRYVEVRGADAGPMPMARGLGALWRGLLEVADARAAAYALVDKVSFAEREALRREVPRAGMAARLGTRTVRDLAVELVRIADAALTQLPGGQGDRKLLEPLRERAESGRAPADDLLADFETAGGDPKTLVARWELRP
ncbi:MAG TPA: glutamate-cysteine ligase family protein [Polyangia bacterium]|nr:glutamate-cysteine ligase family protein [Polyangia bacterium]